MPRPEKPELLSYRALRAMVGLLGVLLPLLVVTLGTVLDRSPLLPSISEYYTLPTPRDVLVGILFAISAFLFAYRGFDERDRIVGKIASLAALGVALCGVNRGPVALALHLFFAAVLLLALAVFSFFLFTMTHEDGLTTPSKDIRNRVYRICGVIIAGCVVAVGVLKVSGLEERLIRWVPVLALESAALGAFGFAWFVKGETLWRDGKDEVRRPAGGKLASSGTVPPLAT